MSNVDWSKYAPIFRPEEFACKCGCGIVHVDPVFLERLWSARMFARRLVQGEFRAKLKMADFPFSITSACRCPKHNANQPGSAADSAHVTTSERPCYAADIAASTGPRRYILVRSLMQAGFERLQPRVSKGFVHVDDDPSKLRPWFS